MLASVQYAGASDICVLEALTACFTCDAHREINTWRHIGDATHDHFESIVATVGVLYLSDDRTVVERLVALLRARWNVWWDDDITHGDWEAVLRAELPRFDLVVPVLSEAARGDRNVILKDEMRLARTQGKPILPFIIGAAELPMGFGDLNYTEALNWTGDATNGGYRKLVSKIAAVLGDTDKTHLRRPATLSVGEKSLQLPSFVFSVSSFETRLLPTDGLSLLHGLEPGAALVSAYDAWAADKARDKAFFRQFDLLRESDTVVVLDSGNYESSRKRDRYAAASNPAGWRRDYYVDAVLRCVPDIAFHFDAVDPRGSPSAVVKHTLKNFALDERAFAGTGITLCPIVHVPVGERSNPSQAAATVVREVATATDPLVIAIPERELGEGLRQRAATVRLIRDSLNSIGRYCPLHLLGTGNPLSMAAFAVAGADLFDGLEWCRTVADYRNGFLFHFQQFDVVGEACLGRIRDARIRQILQSPDAPYTTRALAYNLDFFEDWARTMRDLIHAGQQESLLKTIPDIGPALYKDLCTR